MCVHGSELGNWNTQSLFVVDVVGFFVVVVVFFLVFGFGFSF